MSSPAKTRATSDAHDLSPVSKKYKAMEINVLSCITNVSKDIAQVSDKGRKEQQEEIAKVASALHDQNANILRRMDAIETKFNAVFARNQREVQSGVAPALVLYTEVSKIVQDYANKTKKELAEKEGKRALATEVADEIKTLPMVGSVSLQALARVAFQDTMKAMGGAADNLMSGSLIAPHAQITNDPFDEGCPINATSSLKKVHDVITRSYAHGVYTSIMDSGLPTGFKYTALFNAICSWTVQDPLTTPLKACVSISKNFFHDNKTRSLAGFQFLSTFLSSCKESTQPLTFALGKEGPEKMPQDLEKLLAKEFRCHSSLVLIAIAKPLVKKTQSDPGQKKTGRSSLNLCDTVAANLLHLLMSAVQFRRLVKDKEGWAITKLFSMLIVEGSGVGFDEAFKFFKGCVDEIAVLCHRGIAEVPRKIDEDVFGVIRYESLEKASKKRHYVNFSSLMLHQFNHWFDEVATDGGVVPASVPLENEKEKRMKHLKKLMEMDEE